jgi:hypothetical protein
MQHENAPIRTPARMRLVSTPRFDNVYAPANTRANQTGTSTNNNTNDINVVNITVEPEPDDMIDISECPHDTLNAEGGCMVCGVVCRSFYGNGAGGDHGYTSNHSIPRQSERSISKELDNISLPDDVKSEADRIYQKLEKGTRRGSRRKQLVFFCVYRAYQNLNHRKDPHEIARLIGIPNGDITKAISTYSDRSVNTQKVTQFSPIEFIPQFCEALNLSSECQDNIVMFARSMIAKDADLLDRTPRAVAVGLIMYYLTIITGAVIDTKQFAVSVLMSEVTVNKSCKAIMEIDNR